MSGGGVANIIKNPGLLNAVAPQIKAAYVQDSSPMSNFGGMLSGGKYLAASQLKQNMQDDNRRVAAMPSRPQTPAPNGGK